MLSKEQTLILLGSLATLTVTGLGLAIGGPIGGTIMAGIGINVSSTILQNGCLNLKEKWLYSVNGLVNHDVQRALARAFAKGIQSLSKKYLETEHAKQLTKHERKSIKELFEELEAHSEARLLLSLESVRFDDDVKHFLYNTSEVDAASIWNRIVGDGFASKYGSEVRDFLRDNLLNEMLFWFAEELKTDNRECNKAWRAFQRMILEGLYSDVVTMRGSQEQISQDLQKLARLNTEIERVQETIDRRLPNELFQEEVDAAFKHISSGMATIRRSTLKIELGVEGIRGDVKDILKRIDAIPTTPAAPITEEVLTQLRMKMISAQSDHQLREVQYHVDQLLAQNPTHYNARMLKHQVELALRRQLIGQPIAEEVAMVVANQFYKSRRVLIGLIGAIIVGLILLGYFLLGWFQTP
jgi:hypothetical protein